jgi:hypothetical protein
MCPEDLTRVRSNKIKVPGSECQNGRTRPRKANAKKARVRVWSKGG